VSSAVLLFTEFGKLCSGLLRRRAAVPLNEPIIRNVSHLGSIGVVEKVGVLIISDVRELPM
jgi:hypothetical protein